MQRERALTIAVCSTAVITLIAFVVLWQEQQATRARVAALENGGAGGAGPLPRRDAGTPALDASFDPWACTVELDEASLNTVVRTHAAQVLACAAARADAGAPLIGHVDVLGRVDSSGAVTHVKFVGEARDDAFMRCVTTAAGGWRVPARPNRPCAVFRLPFALRSDVSGHQQP